MRTVAKWNFCTLTGTAMWCACGHTWRNHPTQPATISTNLFGSTFYSLVGLHASHVIVGLILILLILILNITGRIKEYHHEHIIMISWYWHFVDAVWVVVFTVVYVIGR